MEHEKKLDLFRALIKEKAALFSFVGSAAHTAYFVMHLPLFQRFQPGLGLGYGHQERS